MAAQRCRSHQRPPLDAADHLSSLFHFGFFLIFSFFLFSVHFFWLWFDGWVQVVGYGGGWVEMVMGGSVGWVGRLVMGESVVGESVMVNRWWCRSLFWYVFVFVFLFWWWIWQRLWVDLVVVVCFFFFFSWWLWPQQFFWLLLLLLRWSLIMMMMWEEFNILF